MTLEQATPIAESLQNHLAPYCTHCAVAGSIRRRKAEVKDIELVCCPAPAQYADFLAALRNLAIIKGKPTGSARYVRVSLRDIEADIFITTPPQWGWILLLRTGSADFNQRLLAALRALGVTSKEGRLWRDGSTAVPTPHEEAVFAAAGLTFIYPEDRV